MNAWKVRKVNHLPASKLLEETDMRQDCLVHAGLASPSAFSGTTLNAAAFRTRGEAAKSTKSRRPWRTRNDGPYPKRTSTTRFFMLAPETYVLRSQLVPMEELRCSKVVCKNTIYRCTSLEITYESCEHRPD